MTWLDPVLWLAAGWVVPQGLSLARAASSLVALVSPAVLLASFWPPAAAVWLGATLYVALIGLGRWRRRSLEELCVSAGMLYLPVGGAWWLAYKSGWQPLGFSGLIVGLTGIHFHYAGFAALLITGLVGRALRFERPELVRQWTPAALVVLVGPALVAAGIAGSRGLEALSAWLLGLALVRVAWLIRDRSRWHASATLCVGLAMGLAAVYAWGQLRGRPTIPIEGMLVTHGLLNLGFVLCSFVGFIRRPVLEPGLRPSLVGADRSSIRNSGRARHSLETS